MRRIIAFIVFAVTLVTLAIINIPYIARNANVGVEFKGGYEIVYTVAPQEEGKVLTQDEQSALTLAARDVIETRLDIANVKNPIVEVEKELNVAKQIRVTVGAVSYNDFKTIKDLIETNVELSFRDNNDVDLVKQLATPQLGDGSDLLGKKGATVKVVNGQPGIELDINNTELFTAITQYLASRTESGLNKLVIWMNYEEGDSFEVESTKLNSKIIVAIDISRAITEKNPYIQGGFTVDYANIVSNKLKAGSIDFKFVRGNEVKIDASYGKNALDKAVIASIVALIAITIILVAAYGIPGIASSVSLFAYAAFCFATLNFLRAELGPDALSAIVIGAGLAINTTIITFERTKDELRKGRNLRKSYEEGIKKSFSTVIDSNLAALVVSLVLFFIGTRTVKTFSTMLFLSVAFSFIIMILVLRFFLSFIFNSQLLYKHKYLFGIKEKLLPNVKENEPQKYFGPFAKVNFTKNIKKLAFIPLAITVIGALTFGIYSMTSTGLNLGSHFAPGARITITTDVSDYKNVDKIKEIFTMVDIDVSDSAISVGKSTDAKFDVVTVRFEGGKLSADNLNALETKLSEVHDQKLLQALTFDYEVSNVTTAAGMRTLTNALISFAIALGFVLIFSYIRFRGSMAIATVITVILDVAVTCALFVIFHFEINSEFITALLAVATFGVYDVIIFFDRLRENVNEVVKTELSSEVRLGLINKTLQQTFSRTLVSVASLSLVPLALIVFGTYSTMNLALTILFGIITGSFTSIVVAPLIWLFFDNRFGKRALKKKEFKPKKPSNEPEEVIFLGVND